HATSLPPTPPSSPPRRSSDLDGQITLNIGTLATNQLRLGNDYIEFQTRFGGVTETIFVPVAAVSAIYARETGAGMGFEVESSKPDRKSTRLNSSHVKTSYAVF